MSGVQCFAAPGRLEKRCQRAGSHDCRPARSGSQRTAGHVQHVQIGSQNFGTLKTSILVIALLHALMLVGFLFRVPVAVRRRGLALE